MTLVLPFAAVNAGFIVFAALALLGAIATVVFEGGVTGAALTSAAAAISFFLLALPGRVPDFYRHVNSVYTKIGAIVTGSLGALVFTAVGIMCFGVIFDRDVSGRIIALIAGPLCLALGVYLGWEVAGLLGVAS